MAVGNLYISLQFALDVIGSHTRADASMLAFRVPDTFVAGNIHAYIIAFMHIRVLVYFISSCFDFSHITMSGTLFFSIALYVFVMP